MFTGAGRALPVAFIPFKGLVMEVIFNPGMAGPSFTSSSINSRSETNYCAAEQKAHADRNESGSECINEESKASSRSTNSMNNYNTSTPTKEVYKRAEMGKLQSSKYKGVVPQPNGRWGAQIYEKHQRVWLGTYNTEEAAARSYDRAALKFRLRDALTNFPFLHDADPEAVFILRHSKSEIVDMLRKHTFEDELQHYIGESSANLTGSSSFSDSGPPEALRYSPRQHLFDKTMTPSDVGKLNRLVIPKQSAEKYFSLADSAAGKSILLNFQDCAGKTWRFRYTYWNSSQSFVFTKGWNRYVKENELQVGDIVRFERTTVTSGQLYISFCHRISSGFHTDILKPAVPMSCLLSSPSQLCISKPSLTHDTRNCFPGNSCREFGQTSRCSEALKCCLLNGSKRSVLHDGNSSCVESDSLVRQISVSSSCSSRGVMVFGANLSQSLPPATLNLFPGIEVEEEQCKDCERKRKREGPFGFYDGKRQVHNGL